MIVELWLEGNEGEVVSLTLFSLLHTQSSERSHFPIHVI